MSPVEGSTTPSRLIPADRLTWLTREVAGWQADGLVTPESAEQLRGRYAAQPRRFSIVRLALGLGAAFVAAGLIWLVAANIDRLPPMVRFGAVVVLWLAATAAAEVLARRLPRADGSSSPIVGTAQLLAAAAYGAVIFQAAQSLQVPAYSPKLVGFWGLGVLLYAYAVRGLSTLILAIGLLTIWFTWQSASQMGGVPGFVIAILTGGVVASAGAVLHRRLWRPQFAPPWHLAGTLLTLIGLFTAAIPNPGERETDWSSALIVGGVVAAAITVAALVTGQAHDRYDVLVAAAAVGLGALLVFWQPGLPDNDGPISAQMWLRAAVAVLGCLGVAAWIALSGAWREEPALTLLATGFAVVFTTFQSFAVFAPIISGAVLFLVVGAVLLATGYLAERARRHLIDSLSGSEAS